MNTTPSSIERYKDIPSLSDKAKLIEDINKLIENEADSEAKAQLLEQYLKEFDDFLKDCLEFYNKNINSFGSFLDIISSEKDKTIKELQSTLGDISTKLMKEKHEREQEMEHICKLAYDEPDKAVKLLSSRYIENHKKKKYIS